MQLKNINESDFLQNILIFKNLHITLNQYLGNYLKKGEKIKSVNSKLFHDWEEDEKQIFIQVILRDISLFFTDAGAKEQTSVYQKPPPNTSWDAIEINKD